MIALILIFSLIKPSLLVFVILILFVKDNLNFRFTPFQNFIFLSLPIIKEVIRFIASLSKKFDPIWLSSIQDPISGVQRYPDLWLTLGPLKCQSYENYSTFFYFSDFKFNCPAEFYSPIFKYINFPFEVWSGIKVSSFLFLILFIILYFNFLNEYPHHKNLVSIFFLSPVLNFLFYEGNLDILTFTVACIALKNYRKNFILKSLFIFLVSLLEIHSVLIMLGLILASILNKELKVIFTNISFLVFFIIIVFTDVGSSSIRSQFFTTSNYDLGSFENVGNSGVGYGFLLDFKQILIYISPNQYVQIFFSLIALFFISLFFIKNSKGNLNSVSNKLLSDNYYFYGYFLWFISTTMFSNQSYRLANFLPFLFLLFIHSNKLIKFAVLLSLTLTPSTQIFGNIFNTIEIFSHRIGLYTCLIVFMIIFIKNIFEKIEQTKDRNK